MQKQVMLLAGMLTGGILMAADFPPAGYQLLEYLESTGEQYIDTGIYATSNSTISVDFTPLDVTKGLGYSIFDCGQSAVTDPETQMYMRLYINGNGLWAAAAFSAPSSSNDSMGSFSPLLEEMPEAEKRVAIEVDSWRGEVRFNGNRILTLSYPRNGQTPETLQLLRYNTSRMKGRIHSCRIDSAGTPQANLVPCRRTADDALGLYDLVRGQFLMNADSAATVDFIAGPDSSDLAFEIAPIAEQSSSDDELALTLPVVVRTVQCGRVLASGTDYSLGVGIYTDSATGLGTATVTGLGARTGLSATRTFKIHHDGVFRLATWNVGHWAKGTAANSTINWDPDGIPSATRFRAELAAIDADWFGVCEYSQMFCVGPWAGASDCVFQRYPKWELGPQESYQWNGSFHSSRFEILETRIDYYPNHTQNTYAIQHRVRIDGQYEAWFVQTHFDWSTQEIRDSQVQWLIGTFADQPRVIISGDFNTSETVDYASRSRTCDEDYSLFAAAGYTVANSALSTAGTAIIDNVVVKGFRVSGVQVHEAGGLSDHRAMSCILEPLAAGRIAKPSEPMAALYDGEEHVPTIAANPAYTISCGGQVHAGEYPVVVALSDKTNTAWEDGTTDDVELTFTIAKAPNVWTTAPALSVTSWATNEAPATVTAAASYWGTPTANYTAEEVAALVPGEYVYTVSVPATGDYAGLEKSIPFKVYIPFTLSVSYEFGFPVGASMTFAPSERPRTLYLLYDDVDRGGQAGAWTRYSPMATIAPGEWNATVALPRAVGHEYGSFRFVLVENYDLTDYVQDGLVAQWDARENAGRGVYDPAATVWKDLVGSIDLANANWSYASDRAVMMPRGKTVSVPMNGLLAADSTKTVEIVCRTTDEFDTTNSARMDVINLGNDGAIAFRGADNHFISGIFVENADRSAKYFYNNSSADNNAARLRALSSYSAVMEPTFAGSSLNVNDSLFVTGGSPSFWTTTFNHNDNVYVGGNRAPIYVSAIRIYNRALTDAERSANFAVDHSRFLLGGTAGFDVSPVTSLEVPLNAWLRYEGGRLLADVGFAPGDKVKRTLYLAMGPQDFGENREDWPQVVELCVVEKGVNHVYEIDLSEYKERTGFRFFLVDRYDSTTYVQSGLYAQWDAVENAGRGVHDATKVNGWKDLVGSHDLTTSGSVLDLTVTADCIMVPTGCRLTATSSDFARNTARTLETTCFVDSTFDLNSTARCDMLHTCNDCAIAFRGRDTTYTCGIFVNASDTAFYMRPTDTALNNSGIVCSPQSYSLFYAGYPTDSRLHINGIMAVGCGWDNGSGGYTADKTAYKYATSTWKHSTSIGMTAIANARGNLYYHSARIYNRKLTDDERNWNTHVDRCRFCGDQLPTMVSGFIKNRPASLLLFR